MKKIVQVKNVSLTYHSKEGEIQAVDNISFDVYQGEFVSIVGPSGCGKTTILSLISGLFKPSSGTILVNDQIPSPKSNLASYMFQKDNLLPWRNVLKNVYFGLEIQKKLNPQSKLKVIELLNKYGLGEFLKKRPDQLSGGMRQRVALIRTLATDPKVLLLDEPFSALDYQTRLNLCDDVSEIIKKENKTVILVTHDIQEALSMSDRIIVLTSRPAQIKDILDISLNKNLRPFKRREENEFNVFFDKIWSEIQYEKIQ